jgi:hypothetical protein
MRPNASVDRASFGLRWNMFRSDENNGGITFSSLEMSWFNELVAGPVTCRPYLLYAVLAVNPLQTRREFFASSGT